MCGIAGILSFSSKLPDPGAIGRMTSAMSHRGPDADGYYSGNNMTFGHRRLSIIDLSAEANQPFTDNTGRLVIVFNGEIYNYREVKSLLPEYRFRTNSDTEVILAAYEKWQDGCLKYFKGMFAFAIWDNQKNELFVARDRFGVKPLYYFLDKEYFLFASEVRALLKSSLIKKKISRHALLDYFSYQSIGYPHSPLENICQLEAGSWMSVSQGRIEKQRYWDVSRPEIKFDYKDQAGAKEKVRALMQQSIERRLVSDVPVGAFLSGGIDSTAVVGLMAAVSPDKPMTFTVSFEEKEFDESRFADLVAKKFSTVHTRIDLKANTFLDELQNALSALDSPSGDGVNTYVVSKAIRQQGVKVALSGVGGDELFAGYPFFDQYLQLQQYRWLWKLPVSVRRKLAGSFFRRETESRRERLRQLLALDSPSIANAYPLSRQILSAARLSSLTRLAAGEKFTTDLQSELCQRAENISALPYLSQVSIADYLGYTQQTLLKDTDQMSMASSLEVREPFFDPDLVEFVLAAPDHYKKGNYPKKFLVDSLGTLLPDEVVHRKKQGFLFPWSLWLKNELRSFCADHIGRIAQRDFIHGEHLHAYWKNFLLGDPDIRWSEILLFVVLEFWMEKNGIK